MGNYFWFGLDDVVDAVQRGELWRAFAAVERRCRFVLDAGGVALLRLDLALFASSVAVGGELRRSGRGKAVGGELTPGGADGSVTGTYRPVGRQLTAALCPLAGRFIVPRRRQEKILNTKKINSIIQKFNDRKIKKKKKLIG